MTAIIIAILMIFTFAVLGMIGYGSVYLLKNNEEVQSHSEMIKNLSNASFVLGMLTFMFAIFYAPVAFPPKQEDYKITEGNVTLSPEQFKYQKKYSLESYVVNKASGTISYNEGLTRNKEYNFIYDNYPKNTSGSVSFAYNEVWMNAHNDIAVYWIDKKFIAEIGYRGEYKNPAATNLAWVMDRFAFEKMKEEKFE